MANQYRTFRSRGFRVVLVAGCTVMVSGCGGRSLDADGFAGVGGAGPLGATNGSGAGNSSTSKGSGSGNNNGNSDTSGSGNNNGNSGTSGSGNNNGNSGNSGTSGSGNNNGNSGNGNSSVATTGGSWAPGSCQAPWDLNALGGSFAAFSGYSSTFIGECYGAGPELFFTWEAPRSAGYRLHTTGSSNDTVLYSLDGDPCNGRVVDCNDDAKDPWTSELLFNARRGQRMTFVLDTYAAGAVEMRIEEIQLPPCGPSHGELFGVGQLVNQVLPIDETTLGDPTMDSCRGSAPRIAFEWTAPHDGTFTFDTVGSNFDTVLVVRTICEILSGEHCNDDEFGQQSGVIVTANEGQILRIEIAGFDGNVVPVSGDQPIVVLNVR